jgi:hypothetical protein
MHPAGHANATSTGIRRGVTTAYYVVVTTFVAVAVGNVAIQVWTPALSSYPKEDCRSGLYALVQGVDRARAAAGGASDDETTALARFRAALLPEWNRHDAVAASCQRDAAWAPALDVVERLRYAEERAVRRDVTELSPLRRRALELVASRLDKDRNELP